MFNEKVQGTFVQAQFLFQKTIDILILHHCNVVKIPKHSSSSGTFFHWMDKPMCTDCGIKTESNGLTQPTAEERKWEAGRVEAYKCPNCGREERFPRYNHPGKLLGECVLFLCIQYNERLIFSKETVLL